MRTRVKILLQIQPDTNGPELEPYRVGSAVGESSLQLSVNLAYALRELADEIERTEAVPRRDAEDNGIDPTTTTEDQS